MLIPEEGLAEETPIQDFERAEESSAPTSLSAYIRTVTSYIFCFPLDRRRCAALTKRSALHSK